ncbi:MAG TPA: hypothetical protein PLB91_03045, partial [Spirochaetales bacterium]|nr:hypothetical protein [Spirochaetales bacterium]
MRLSRPYILGLALLFIFVAAGGLVASPGEMALLLGSEASPAAAAAAARRKPPAAARPWFPALYNPEVAAESSGGAEPGVLDGPDPEAGRAAELPVLANNQVLAFYGKPDSRRMGILGEYSKEELAKLLRGYAKLYDEANGEPGVVPAFYLIYGTCWPGGEIGY